jgi:hypothetical protein
MPHPKALSPEWIGSIRAEIPGVRSGDYELRRVPDVSSRIAKARTNKWGKSGKG